ncbi:MAG: type III secretion system export apparatus subunit SctR, partial [Planctomycetaceae bacterium]|nr:type III secretion system export apparatus subunit SctR [Planctomycetaceae bacterium]
MQETLPDPIYLVGILVFLSLAPFLAIMVTSFVKLVVVLSLIRNALGIQQIPPNMVINGLAIILTMYIMNPVAQETFTLLEEQRIDIKSVDSIRTAFDIGKEPLKRFLLKHSSEEERIFFYNAAEEMWPEEQSANLANDDLMILVPAFTVGELKSAFQIGFLIYLPFIAIDIIVSNILLSMGMMMVSPIVFSLP